MTGKVVAETSAPTCAQHGEMTERASGTNEQAWCGHWYHCDDPYCRTVRLIPSPELTVWLNTQESR